MANWLQSLNSSETSITICYEIEMPLIIKKIISDTELAKQEPSHISPKGRLNEDLGRLLKGSDFSDVVIVGGNQTLPGHKIILASRSPVLAAMMKEVRGNGSAELQVEIKNMELDVVKAMLEYLYTDDVSNLGEIPFTYELLAAADRFQLPHLKTICGNVLVKELKAKNAAEIMGLLGVYGQQEFTKSVSEFIRNNFQNMMNTRG